MYKAIWTMISYMATHHQKNTKSHVLGGICVLYVEKPNHCHLHGA